MPRLFIAIPLPDDIRAALVHLRSGIPGARWLPESNLHLTLRFIGDVHRDEADDVADALGQIEAPAFDMSIEGVGMFGERKRPRILWAGIARNDALVHLQRKVESAVVRAGLGPEERRFTPHITLARLKGAKHGPIQTFMADNTLVRLGPVEVDAFNLYSSIRTPDGPHYALEAEYPLLFSNLF